MTLEVTQAIYHFLLVTPSNDSSVLNHFPSITTFVMYVTTCDLAKSFNFDMIAQNAFRFVYKQIVKKLARDIFLEKYITC